MSDEGASSRDGRANLSMDQGVKNVGESWRLERSPHSDSRGLLDLQLMQINLVKNARLQFSTLSISGLGTHRSRI
jgi:hypothetical protein